MLEKQVSKCINKVDGDNNTSTILVTVKVAAVVVKTEQKDSIASAILNNFDCHFSNLFRGL